MDRQTFQIFGQTTLYLEIYSVISTFVVLQIGLALLIYSLASRSSILFFGLSPKIWSFPEAKTASGAETYCKSPVGQSYFVVNVREKTPLVPQLIGICFGQTLGQI